MSEETPEPKVVKDNVTDEKGVTEKPESSKDETDSRVQNLNPGLQNDRSKVTFVILQVLFTVVPLLFIYHVIFSG